MADVRTFLRQLLAELDSRRDRGDRDTSRTQWLETIDGYRKQWNAFIAPGRSDDAPLSTRNAQRTRSIRRFPPTPFW